MHATITLGKNLSLENNAQESLKKKETIVQSVALTDSSSHCDTNQHEPQSSVIGNTVKNNNHNHSLPVDPGK